LSLRAVSTDLRVRYSETDQMGIVYHAHYLVWFEIGRTEWCRAAGLPYAEMERSGIFIPVTRVECAYEIVNPDGELLAEGSTDHIFTNVEGRPARAAPEVVAALRRFRDEEALP
jgi:acyl-CoA thioester hydrolase